MRVLLAGSGTGALWQRGGWGSTGLGGRRGLRCGSWRTDAVLLPGRLDFGRGAHVGEQGLRDRDRAVRLLVVFQDGDQGAADGQAASIEGVGEFGLPAVLPEFGVVGSEAI